MTTTQNPTTARANVTTLNPGDEILLCGASRSAVGDARMVTVLQAPIHVRDDSVSPAEALVDIEVEEPTGFRWFIQRPTWASIVVARKACA